MFCDVEMDDPAPIVNQDDQYKQDLRCGRRHDEKVDRGEFSSMLLEKSSSARGGRFAVPGFIPLDGGLCDFELQRQASSSRRTNERK